MAFTDTQALVAQLKLDDKFSGPLKNAGKTLSGFGGTFDSIGKRAKLAGSQIGTGISNGVKIAAIGIGFLATQVIVGLRSLVKLEGMTTQTNAVLRSTGGISGQTAASVRKLAEQYESLNATIGDEVIQSAENMLLTFTRVRGKAFEPALVSILDMNTALGRGPDGLVGTALQVGKALNDPSKGLLALRRAGVLFTDDQVKQIKVLQKSGDIMGAQKIILAELEKEFGGSFIAGGTTTAGKVAKFTDSIEDLQRALATALLPTIGIVADKLTTFLSNPALAGQVTELGRKIAGLFSDANIQTGGEVLTGLFNAAKAAAGPLQSAAEVTGRVVGEAVNMFKSLPPELQAVLVGGLAVNKLTGGLVTNVAGGAIDAVGSVLGHFLERGASPANPLFVAQVGGIPGLPGTGAGPGDVIGTGVKLAAAAAIGVGIAAGAAIVIAGGAAANAIDPSYMQAVNDPSIGTPLGQRDPRRFNSNGQVVRNVLPNRPNIPPIAGSRGPLGPQGSTRIGAAIGRVIAPALGRGAAASGRSARASAAAAAAIRAKRLVANVRVMNTVKVENSLNGRVFSAQLNRYVNVYSNSGQFGGTGPR